MNTNTGLRYGIFAGLFFIPFIAFIVTPSMLFPFITGKNFAFRIIVEIIFALWVLLMFRDKHYRPKFSWILGAFLIFTAIVGTADMFGVNPIKSFWSNFERMEGYLAIFHLLLYFIVSTSMLNTQKLWNWFWGTWVGSAFLMCIFGLFQLAGKATINQGGSRVDGRLGNATYLAVFLLFTIFLSTFLFVRSKQKMQHVWYYVPVVLLQLVILYYTATRGAILGLIGGVIVSVFLTLFFEKKDKKYRNIASGILIGVLVLVAGFYSIRNTDFVQKSTVLARFASISPSEIKTQGRYFIWPMAVKGSLERPILGWGQENFNYIFNKDYNPKMYAQEQWFDRAHSAPLDWLVAGGILGFATYLSLFFFALYYLWKRNKTFTFFEKGIITGLLSAYFFQNLFVFDNLIGYVLFVSLLAFIHDTSSTEIEWPHWFSNEVVQYSVSSVVGALILISLYFFNIQPIRASQTLIDALVSVRPAPTMRTLDLFEEALTYSPLGRPEIREQLVNSTGDFMKPDVANDVKQRFSELTMRELGKQIIETPNDARYFAFYGTFFRGIGDLSDAMKELEKALELTPKKQSLWFEYGATKIAAKDYEGALKAMKTAYDLEPSYNDAVMLYAITALYNNKTDLAGHLLGSLPRDVVLFDDRLIGVLVDRNNYMELVQIFTARIAEGKDEMQNNISLSISYLRLGEQGKAVEVLQKYIERHPEAKTDIEPYIEQIKAGKTF